MDLGPLRGVHQLRQQYGADLVCMITETTGGPLGLANLMHESEVGFSRKAFSVVQRQYANTYFVLAHEIGHNFGCQHDWASSSSGGLFSSSHGYAFTVGGLRYRTVMATQPGLPIPYYSNPDVSYLGVPTGVPDGQPAPANNARTLTFAAPTVARFSSVLLTGAPPVLTLLFPLPGAMVAPGPVPFSVDASDVDGTVVDVDFYLDGQDVAEFHAPPYEWTWTNATPGLHFFRAEARDNTGWKVSVPMVRFTVTSAPPSFDAGGAHMGGDGRFRVLACGILGQEFRIDISTDLRDWTPMATNIFGAGPFEWFDERLTNQPACFYRVVVLP